MLCSNAKPALESRKRYFQRARLGGSWFYWEPHGLCFFLNYEHVFLGLESKTNCVLKNENPWGGVSCGLLDPPFISSVFPLSLYSNEKCFLLKKKKEFSLLPT